MANQQPVTPERAPGLNPNVFNERGADPPMFSQVIIVLITVVILAVLFALTKSALQADPAMWDCVNILNWMFSREP